MEEGLTRRDFMGAAMLLPAWKAALPQQSRVGLGTWQTFDALDTILPLFVQLGGSVGHAVTRSRGHAGELR